MKKNEAILDLSAPVRQSPVALLLILIKMVRVIIRQIWPILLVVLIRPGKSTGLTLTYIAIATAAVIAVGSIISYFRFFFYLEGGELVIEKGVFRRSRLNVPIDRIQTIEFQQGPIHQAFNVVEVEIDTAGSKKQEFSISALSREKAEALRLQLNPTGKKQVEAAEEEEEKELLRLKPFDLLKIGISQNHLRTAGILLALVFSTFDSLEDALGESIYSWVASYFGISIEGLESGDSGNLFLFFIGLIALLIVSFFGSMILTVFRHFNLRFLQTGTGFQIKAGLINRREQAARLNKIQFLRWSSNPIQRWFGFSVLRLYQAASESVSRRRSLSIPGLYEKQIASVRKAYFPHEVALPTKTHEVSYLYQRRRFLFLGIIPFLGLLLIGWLRGNTLGLLWILLWLPVAWYWAMAAYRNRKFSISTEGLLNEKGVFTKTKTSLQWHKIQSAAVRQTIYQRRRGIANLRLYTAAGMVQIPYMELEKARRLRDYILYRVESTQLEWM